MEGKSAPPDMISMSRSSRDNRASKNPKVTADTISVSKKSQIRASGTSPRPTPASKKAKTGGESLAGGSTKPDAGSGRTDKSGSLRVISRSKRAAESFGDVTLDAFRPVKKRKIRTDSGDGPASPTPRGQGKSVKSEGENGRHPSGKTDAPALATATKAFPDSARINPNSGVGIVDSTTRQRDEFADLGGSAHQIGSRVTGTRNGLSGAAKRERALRPRSNATAAPKVKKRTKFHEVTLEDGDGPRIVGRRIKVFWPLENKFFYGHVKAFNGARKLQHKIVYDDKDEEWLRLQNEIFGIELVPGEVFGVPASSAPATETKTTSVANDVSENSVDNRVHPGGGAHEPAFEVGKVSEAAREGRIKPEGVYRRKRKADRAGEETEEQLDGTIAQQKNAEGDREPTKKLEGDGESTDKLQGGGEPKKKLEGKRGGRKKGEGSSKQRGALAEGFGRVNGKRSTGNSVVRERRKKGLAVVTSRDLRQKVLSGEGAISRRKRAGMEKSSRGSAIHTRTRHAIAAEKEGKKGLRSRIRDDDRLFTSVKSSGTVIRRKVDESKRSKEAKVIGRISNEKPSSNQTRKEVKSSAEDEKLVGNVSAAASDRMVAEDLLFVNQGTNAPGPFEAVMDAYREAFSESKDPITDASPTREPEELSSEEVSDEDQTVVELDDDPRSGGAAPVTPQAVDEHREQAGNEAEGDVLSREESGGDEQSMSRSREFSTTEVVPKTPLISRPVTRLRPEFKYSPDKVYRRLKKYHQPDKVYRRLKKHSRNKKVHNKGVDEQADESQTVVPPVPQYWFLAKPLPSPSHVSSFGARIAALGFSLPSFCRIAFARLQCRSRTEDGRFQLGTFYGVPSMQSLLRVSWKSLDWLFAAMSVSVSTVDDASSIVASFSVKKNTKSKLLNMIITKRGFKRQGISSRNAYREFSPFRHLLDPSSDLKFLSMKRRYVRRPGVRSIVCLGSAVIGAPSVVPRKSQPGHGISSAHPTPSHGQMAGDLCTGEPVVSSGVLRRVLSLADPLINRWKAATINVLMKMGMGAATRTLSVTFPISPSVSGEQSGSCREVGAYYGRPSMQSFFRFATNKSFRVDERSLPSTESTGSRTVSVELGKSLENPRIDAAVGDASSLNSSNELTSCHLLDVDEGCSLLCQGEVIVDQTWFISFNSLAVHPLILSQPYIFAPDLPHFYSTSSVNNVSTASRTERFVHSIESAVPKVAGSEGWAAELARSIPVIPDEDDTAGKWNLFALGGSRPASEREISGSNCRQIGTHYGRPSVESILRVSRNFWLWLLIGHRKPRQHSDDSPAAHVLGVAEDPGTLPQANGPELSSTETVDDDYQSDQEDRITCGEGRGEDEAQDTAVGGDEFQSSKQFSKSVGSMTKGRRTGKGLKRGFGQIAGDSVGRDGLGLDSLQDGDQLSSRPYSKRTRLEIESSGAATNRDSGTETSPPSDLEGKGFAAPSSEQLKAKGLSAPRMNVLKLRRCPTNKGVWQVLGNSCAPPQDTGTRVAGEADPSNSLDSGDLGEGGEPVTPIFASSRKRALDQCLESPQFVRNDQSGNPPVTNTMCNSDPQDRENAASGVKAAKAYSLNAKSREVWFDCGVASVNGGVPDGLETRKRRRKGLSPVAGDDVDGISEHLVQRSADTRWGSCSANLLITKSDRCVRETGAIIELQPGHGNGCTLTVSLRGESKYSLKADQPVASGTTNKYTHSMMWRGGKAWSLEFVDRKQWQLFKDLHEECFQRNARAASVRHIPIPGVKPISESPKWGPRFVRPSLKYIHQYDGEVEMALASTRIMYDMDSEDEEWLNHANSEMVGARGTRSRPQITEDSLEGVMDKLEKASFMRQEDPILSAEVAAELCQAFATQDVIKAIHSYWLEKRLRKRMALVRHFQPAPWEQYQTQLQDWQSKIDQLQQLSPTATKQQLQSLCKRPPLFAFCLRPRGLESRNKMQKQRSQRKQGLGGSSSRQWTLAGHPSDFYLDSPSRRPATFDSTGGPFYGSRKFARLRSQEDTYSDPMPVDLTASFNALAIEGYNSRTDAGQVASDARVGTGCPLVDGNTVLQYETVSTGGFNKRTKKIGRKAKKKLIAAAEESTRKRQLRAQQGHLNGKLTETVSSPHSLSEGQVPVDTDPSPSGISLMQLDGQEEDKVALAKSTAANAKAKREIAIASRAHAHALYAVADAAMHKAVAAVIAADAIHAAEGALEEAPGRDQEPAHAIGIQRQQTGEALVSLKDDSGRPWGRSETSGGGAASFGSWRRALNSASKNANHVLAKGSTSKPGMMADTDDPLLPVASWSQELGAGLGTRLLQTGEVSQRQRYSPVLVEGLPKSPTRGGRGEGHVSLGRTRGESMMAMLTR